MVTLEMAARAPAAPEAAPFHEWVFPNGQLWTSFFRTPAGYLLRFPGIADFTLDEQGRRVAVWPAPGVSQDAVDLVYINQVLPLAWSKQGRLVLHASAVELGGRAAVFIGLSGHGKSTLAASLVAAGSRLLTDDALVIEVTGQAALAMPGHPSLRLWSDSEAAVGGTGFRRTPPVHYTTKARFAAVRGEHFCAEPLEVACAFFLGAGSSAQPAIEPVTGAAALVDLVKHSFLLDTDERALLSTHFDAVSRLAALPLWHRLDYPRDYAVLPRVHDAIRDCMAAKAAQDGR